MVKRRRTSSSSSSSSSPSISSSTSSFSRGGANGEDERQRLLALLDAQCGATTGIISSIPACGQDDETDEGHDDDEEDDSETERDDRVDSDGEWNGFSATTVDEDENEDDGMAMAMATRGLSKRGDRGRGRNLQKKASTSSTHLPSASSSSAPVIVFHDTSSSSRNRSQEDTALVKERDSFMSTKVRNAAALAEKEKLGAARDRKGKGRQRATSEELAEEKHLQQLDSSLMSLIKDLPASTTSTSLLPKLDALTLPDPRLTVRKDKQAPIDKKAPRLLREALYSSRQKRAMTKAQEEREAGIVTANASRNKNELNGFALTKARRREQTGEESKRRQTARGLGGVVGKMRKGGAVLTLNKDEIRRGNEGDLDGLIRRKRPKGGPPPSKKGRTGKR